MPSKPSIYQWAVANLFASGPAVGTPTRVAPTSGVGSQQDQGLVPGAALGAQLLNAIFGNVFDALAYALSNQIDGSLTVGGCPLTATLPFAFTATSGSPGFLTATAHGLQTGDGPVRVSNSGGGLPGGLAAGTDYWVIVVDANTLRLAVDRTNAIRTTPVPVVITSNGTGTQTLAAGTSPTRLGDLTVTRALAVNGTMQTGHKLKVGGMPLVFPSFAFTADSTTDKLTFTDHGLTTGDGPIQVSNSGGALPGGLTPSTDYWVITVDTNNVKLATSFVNALAGVAIDLTTNGSGTNTLAGTGSTVAPAGCEVTGNLTVDGNSVVTGSETVGGALAVTGSAVVTGDLTVSGTTHYNVTRRFLPRFWTVYSGSAAAVPAADPGSNLSPVWSLSVNTTLLDTFGTPIDFVPGETVSGFKVDLYGDGSGTTTYDLILNYYPTAGTAVGSVVQIAHISGTGSTAAWSARTLTIDAPGQVLASTGVLFLLIKVHSTSSAHTAYVGNVSAQTVL